MEGQEHVEVSIDRSLVNERIRNRLRRSDSGRVEETHNDLRQLFAGGSPGNPGPASSERPDTGDTSLETPSDTGSARRKPGRPRKDRSGSSGTDSQQTASVGEEEVTVEASPDKPATVRRTRKAKGVIQPEHIEMWTVQVFSLVAMVKNADYWAVTQPEIEVRPWAIPAAELLNKIPAKYAEQAIVTNAAVAVVAGVGMMVYRRSMIDMMRGKAMKSAQATATFEEKERANTAASQPTNIGSTQHTPSSGGAAPVGPPEPLFGTYGMASDGAI